MGILSVIDKWLYKCHMREIETRRRTDFKCPFLIQNILFFVYVVAFAVYTMGIILLSLLLNKLLETKLDKIFSETPTLISITLLALMVIWIAHFLIINYRDRNKELYELGKRKYKIKVV